MGLMPARNIDRLAEKLGAKVIGRVPAYSSGTFGVSLLAKTLRERLEPQQREAVGSPAPQGEPQSGGYEDPGDVGWALRLKELSGPMLEVCRAPK